MIQKGRNSSEAQLSPGRELVVGPTGARVGEEAGECSKMLTVNQREWYMGVLFFYLFCRFELFKLKIGVIDQIDKQTKGKDCGGQCGRLQ